MELKEILKIDVNDKHVMRSLSYKKTIYYCGNHNMQNFWSKVKNALEVEGVEFPFNPACFKHDMAYGAKPTLMEKAQIDFTFYEDMMNILESKKDEMSAKLYRRLKWRARLYFAIVIIMTPIYMKMGLIEK